MWLTPVFLNTGRLHIVQYKDINLRLTFFALLYLVYCCDFLKLYWYFLLDLEQSHQTAKLHLHHFLCMPACKYIPNYYHFVADDMVYMVYTMIYVFDAFHYHSLYNTYQNWIQNWIQMLTDCKKCKCDFFCPWHFLSSAQKAKLLLTAQLWWPQ